MILTFVHLPSNVEDVLIFMFFVFVINFINNNTFRNNYYINY